METIEHTEEEERYFSDRWGITVEQFRALPEIEKFHHEMYGPG